MPFSQTRRIYPNVALKTLISWSGTRGLFVFVVHFLHTKVAAYLDVCHRNCIAAYINLTTFVVFFKARWRFPKGMLHCFIWGNPNRAEVDYSSSKLTAVLCKQFRVLLKSIIMGELRRNFSHSAEENNSGVCLSFL